MVLAANNDREWQRRRLLYVDREVCIFDKPSGARSYATPDDPTNPALTLAAALLAETGEPQQLFAVHRLDEETSGALVFARDERTKQVLEEGFRKHTFERVYHALVLGHPEPARGRLESRLEVDAAGVVRPVGRGGRLAVTEYVTVAQLDGCAVLACRLETGRRNQVRVQLADIGHPIAGDRKYGRTHAAFRRVRAQRAMLHATGIELDHPTSGARMAVVAPIPDDMSALIGSDLAARLTPSPARNQPRGATRGSHRAPRKRARGK